MTMTAYCFNRRAMLAALAATLAPPARADDPAPGRAEFDLLVKEGRYLPLLRFYQNQAGAGAAWLTAQLAAMTGDEAGAYAVPPAVPPVLPDLSGCRAVDALETIVLAARHRQIVILNEAHHASRCRAFASTLAERLHQEGFTVFAAEAFDNAQRPSAAAAALNAGAAVTPAIGWYAADPVFAEAVRSARRQDYRFGAYEARAIQLAGTSGDREMEAREDGEANNFIADILAANPKARVFVYCGYDHVMKAEDPHGQMWFAARLKAKTGIDPLCISQSWGLPPPDLVPPDPGLKALLDQFALAVPAVLFDRNNHPVPLAMPAGTVDVEVVHPQLPPVDGRPGWLTALPGRKKAVFALAALTGAHDLVKAVPAGEAVNPAAVPSDQYPLKPGTREAVFFLAAGRYEIRLETDDGRRVLGALTV